MKGCEIPISVDSLHKGNLEYNIYLCNYKDREYIYDRYLTVSLAPIHGILSDF